MIWTIPGTFDSSRIGVKAKSGFSRYLLSSKCLSLGNWARLNARENSNRSLANRLTCWVGATDKAVLQALHRSHRAFVDQTEGIQLLQQIACWVDKGQAGEHEIRMDVALHEVWRMQSKKQPKSMDIK